MTSEGLTPPNRQPFVLRWLVVRVIAPLCVALVLLHFTGDVRDPGDRGKALLWTVFIVHLTGVFTAPKTNVLDVGAFVILVPVAFYLAEMEGREYSAQLWVTPVLSFGAYAFLTWVGSRRAARQVHVPNSVRLPHVITAFTGLVVAIVICGATKAGAGLLLLPGCGLIPFLLWTLAVNRSSRPTQLSQSADAD